MQPSSKQACVLEDKAERFVSSRHLQQCMDLILHIFSFMSNSQKAAVAKLVCKDAYSRLKEFVTVDVTCSSLPVTYLLERLKQQQNVEQQRKLIVAVAKKGDLQRVQFLSQHNCAYDHQVLVVAARTGNMAILEWALEQNPRNPSDPIDPDVLAAAAESGQLAVLQYFITQRQQFSRKRTWGPQVTQAAARGGQLEVLQWLRAQKPQCQWDIRVPDEAAGQGNLEILKWVRAQEPPCDWSKSMCIVAARAGHVDVLQWALAQNPPAPFKASACAHEAAEQGHLNVLQFIARHIRLVQHLGTGSQSHHQLRTSCLESAMRNNHSEMVRWLVSLG